MHYKKSEDIARNAYLIGCDPDDVSILDKYLAHRNRNCFTLFDVKHRIGLGEYAEPLLNEFVQEGILREPKSRHLCPEHDIDLEIVNANEGKCIDCDATHLLDDCETEVVYERIATPETWSNSEASTLQSPDYQQEPPLLKDRRLHIAVISTSIAALVAVYIHFNPVNATTPDQFVGPTVTTPVAVTTLTSPPSDAGSATRAVTITATLPPTAELTPISKI